MGDWFECTKISAYYLWEQTQCDNALLLWYAAEDIACFFEQANILDPNIVEGIRKLGPGSEGYVWFVRNIAFRLFLYTDNNNDLDNWFLVERLLGNSAWVQNLTAMASMLHADSSSTIKQVRSDMIRSFYS